MLYEFISADDISVFEDEFFFPDTQFSFPITKENLDILKELKKTALTTRLDAFGKASLEFYTTFTTIHQNFDDDWSSSNVYEYSAHCLANVLIEAGFETSPIVTDILSRKNMGVCCIEKDAVHTLLFYEEFDTQFLTYIQLELEDIHAHGHLTFDVAEDTESFCRLLDALAARGFHTETLQIREEYVKGVIVDSASLVSQLDKIHLDVDYTLIDTYRNLIPELVESESFSKQFLRNFLYFLENNGRYYLVEK